MCVTDYELTYYDILPELTCGKNSHINQFWVNSLFRNIYRKHICKVFSWNGKTIDQCIKNPSFCASLAWNCQWMIHLMFYTLSNGTNMFVDHENLGRDVLISQICWIYKEKWQKYYFPVMASTKWPPFCPKGETCMAPYLKSLAMIKGIIIPNFMLVPQNASFFIYRLDYVRQLIRKKTVTWPPVYT